MVLLRVLVVLVVTIMFVTTCFPVFQYCAVKCMYCLRCGGGRSEKMVVNSKGPTFTAISWWLMDSTDCLTDR